MKLFFACLVVVSSFASAQHREHKAHKHGAGKFEMAFQGANGQIDIEAPSEGLYGFEYVPNTDDDKRKQHDALSLLETNISDMIKFDPELKCEISKIKIEVDQHEGGKHSDIDASFKVICQKSPLGTTFVFNIQKTFPKLKDVKIDVVVDDLQKSFVANKDGSKLVLKK